MRVPWVQFVWEGAPAVRYPEGAVRPMHVPATPEHPAGWKGGVLRRCLREYPAEPGIVTLDPDVAIEPDGVLALEEAITADPSAVWTAPARIWLTHLPGPRLGQVAADGREDMDRILAEAPDGRWASREDGAVLMEPRPVGVYAHRVWERGRVRWGRPDDDVIHMWGFSCTYLPMALLRRVEKLGAWDRIAFPLDDVFLNRIAWQEPRIRARLAARVRIAHVHWDESSLAALYAAARPPAAG